MVSICRHKKTVHERNTAKKKGKQKIKGRMFMKTRFSFVVLFCMTFAAFAQDIAMDSPLAGWQFNDFFVTLNGRRFTKGQVAESWREQEGYAIVGGERLRYWLYDTVLYHGGKADDIYNRYIPYWVEQMGYAIDYDNIEQFDPNTNLATSVRALMIQRGCDISVVLTDGPVYKYVYINEWFKSKGTYKTTVYPLLKGELNIAIVEYTRRIKLNPNDAVSYFNRGKAYYQKYWDGLGSVIIEGGKAKVDSSGRYVWAEAPIDEAYWEYFLDSAHEDFKIAVRLEPTNARYKKELDEFGK
jgi:tetratricopeptide (TPR) repeat protein